MIVIGLMGRIGSGKGTVAEILVDNYGFKSIVMGDLAREEVVSRGFKPGRETTIKVVAECFAKDPAYFIKKAVKRIKDSGHDKWVIDGIRQPLDVHEFRKAFPKMKFIKVDVEPRTRFERMRLRARPGFPDTFEKFKEHERLEDERFKLDETLSRADYVLDNNGSYEDLNKAAHKLIKKLL
jgi:dephospho-CoA kinase